MVKTVLGQRLLGSLHGNQEQRTVPGKSWSSVCARGVGRGASMVSVPKEQLVLQRKAP